MIGTERVSGTLRAVVSRAAGRVPWLGPRVLVRLHRAGLGASPFTWEDLAAEVERHRPDVLSVDVFDTCVVRDLLGDRPIELAIDRRLNGSAHTAERVTMAAEMEAALCRAVPGVVEALARVRRAGVSVTFLSDTERSSDSLRTMLSDLDIHVRGDRLIASCEAGATKSDGDLFAKAWSSAQAEERSVWHVGNNYWSDVTMAEQAGLTAVPIVRADPTRYEAAMAARPETVGPAVAAAARNVRLAIAADEGGEKLDAASKAASLETIGAEVAGQAFSAFLLWVAERTRSEGLAHLAFLSRDGELPLEMARAMPADHWDGVEFSYLHCSRWSWLLSGAATYGLDHWLEVGTKDERAFIHSNRHRAPFPSVLGRIGLLPGDLTARYPTLAALGADDVLPVDLVPDWEALLADPAIGEVILARATDRKDLLVAYLSTVGLPSGRIGMVDVGWRGRLAWAMSPVIAEVTGQQPLHLHVGGDKVHADVARSTDIARFAFDGPSGSSRISNPVSCVETLTASGRARVVGYRADDDGGVGPLFEREVAEIHNADRRRLWRGAVRTAAALPARAVLDQLGCSHDSLAPEAVEVLARWWTEPVRDEAEAMRGLSFETDDDGRSIRPLLTPYSAREFSPDVKHPRQWRQGSAAVSPRPFAAIVTLYHSIRSRLDRG